MNQECYPLDHEVRCVRRYYTKSYSINIIFILSSVIDILNPHEAYIKHEMKMIHPCEALVTTGCTPS
jgi:hypothetical protein